MEKKAANEYEYLVQVLRPVFELATIRVRAGCEEEAQLLAVEQAAEIPAGDWLHKFSSEDYAYDCVTVLEVEGDRENANEDAEFMTDDTKYVLLKASLATGEGELRLQPWLYQTSGLMLADICDDWAGALSDLSKLSEEGWEQLIEEASTHTTMSRTIQVLASIARRKPIA
ncbi:MAG: hypothetical protein IPI02_10335 [Sterolibacteriaceae bacterium]|nr:hypothetical protein [Sterolibacteriaceae bacterium]